MLPASGYTTASAKPTATAASTAFPPRRMTSMPAWPASGASLATIPCAPKTARRPALYGHAAGKTAGRRSPEYIAAPSAGARLGEPTSVADGNAVCAERQEDARIAAVAQRTSCRLMLITVSLSEAETRSRDGADNRQDSSADPDKLKRAQFRPKPWLICHGLYLCFVPPPPRIVDPRITEKRNPRSANID